MVHIVNALLHFVVVSWNPFDFCHAFLGILGADKYRASAQTPGPKHDTRFERVALILIITQQTSK